MKQLVCFFTLFLIFGWPTFTYAGEFVNKTDMVYSDDSHCLVAPEIRGKNDYSISCFCRDAIMDARYVFYYYLRTEKDNNLGEIYITLLDYAQQMCGEKYDDLYEATQNTEWQWNGPQITREYPPEEEIQKSLPDSKGFLTVEYKVRLTYIGADGRVIKVENFTALDKLAPNTKKK